jgi:hypothetical protein
MTTGGLAICKGGAMFWYNWPSWVTELLGGAALYLVLLCPLGPWLALVGSLVISVAYEKWLDRNGWSLSDLGQRTCGTVAVFLVTLALR